MSGGDRTDTAPAASGEAKEKAGLRTRIAVRLPGGERISTDRSGSGDPGSAWWPAQRDSASLSTKGRFTNYESFSAPFPPVSPRTPRLRGAPPHASERKTCRRHVFFTLGSSVRIPLFERRRQNRYRPSRERRGKRKGRAQNANCVQAQPGGPPRGIRTPDLQNRNLTLYPAALWADIHF